MRVLVTGAGGELGYRVTTLLEADRSVEAIAAVDMVQPRRRYRRAKMTVLDPRQRRRTVELVARFRPTAIVHLGVYEPDARSNPQLAAERTRTGTMAVLGAAADLGGALERIVVRSAVEVYGRGPGLVTVPDETVPPDPRTAFGSFVVDVERLAASTAAAAGVPAALLRFAPILGPDLPNPLSRLLRLPVVPVPATTDPVFQVLHVDDAADAVMTALRSGFDGPANVVGGGAVSVLQAVRLTGGIPLPVLSPAWPLVRRLAAFAGAPLPEHHVELLLRGRAADGSMFRETFGLLPRACADVIRDSRWWPRMAPLRLVEGAA
jgi:UDP-glucose 4-epimerase